LKERTHIWHDQAAVPVDVRSYPLLQMRSYADTTTHDQRRRRSSARSRTTRPPVSGSPQSPTSAALDHPETEQEWANVIDGPLSTQRPDHAAGADGVDGGAPFVDSVQAGTIG
jgi:hypothetical protein